MLAHHWQRPGLTLTADDFTDSEAVAAVARITNGNFRLVQRLFAHITRILDINQLTTVTSEVVQAARDTLVIGKPEAANKHSASPWDHVSAVVLVGRDRIGSAACTTLTDCTQGSRGRLRPFGLVYAVRVAFISVT